MDWSNLLIEPWSIGDVGRWRIINTLESVDHQFHFHLIVTLITMFIV